jgi:hypothetical protein
MKQYEAVIKVMKENGGYATLSHLYENALKVPGVKWKAKDPYANIRRIVQERPEIFKIKPGLWALVEYKDSLPSDIKALMEPETEKGMRYGHYYYQGLIAEIGAFNDKYTFIPSQDRNRPYLGGKLGDVATIPKIFDFGYPHIVKRASTVDVIWFNERKMPHSFFEVEHSTDFQNSLLKFFELQDYYANFYIVSDENRKREYEKKIRRDAFRPIQKRVKFVSYDHILKLYRIEKERKSIINLS